MPHCIPQQTKVLLKYLYQAKWQSALSPEYRRLDWALDVFCMGIKTRILQLKLLKQDLCYIEIQICSKCIISTGPKMFHHHPRTELGQRVPEWENSIPLIKSGVHCFLFQLGVWQAHFGLIYAYKCCEIFLRKCVQCHLQLFPPSQNKYKVQLKLLK